MLIASKKSDSIYHVESKFFVKEEPFLLTVNFEENFSYEDFKKAIDLIYEKTKNESYNYLDPICYYRESSPVNYRGKVRLLDRLKCRFFYHNGTLAYTPTGRTGWYISDMSFRNIKEIKLYHKNHPEILEQEKEERYKLWNRIQKSRYDEHTWSNLTIEHFKEKKHPFFYIKKVFNERELREIEDAFQNKRSFRIQVEKAKRHYTAEGKMGEDGIYRAWFSSEFIGMLHGDYYYLLNPKVAVFAEHD